MDEQVTSNSLQVEEQPEVVVNSPYPREVVAAPLFKPWYQRVAVDLVSVGLGWSIGGLSPRHPYAVELNLASALLGVAWSYWVQQRGLGFSWRSVGFGIGGLIFGRMLLPPIAGEPAWKYSELVFENGLVDYMVSAAVGFLFWCIAGRGRMVRTIFLDGYEAFRSSIWHGCFFVWVWLTASTSNDQNSVRSILITVLIVMLTDVALTLRQARTRAAVWATCWTPIGIAFLAFSPNANRFSAKAGDMVFFLGLLIIALMVSVLFPTRAIANNVISVPIR